MKRIVVLAITAVLASVVLAAEDSINVTESGTTELCTQVGVEGSGTCHVEGVYVRYGHEQSMLGRHVSSIDSTTPVNIYATPVDCHSVIIVADLDNADAVFVGYSAAGTVSNTDNSIPIYAGGRQQLRAPNSGDCKDIQVVGGPACANCKVYVLAQ